MFRIKRSPKKRSLREKNEMLEERVTKSVMMSILRQSKAKQRYYSTFSICVSFPSFFSPSFLRFNFFFLQYIEWEWERSCHPECSEELLF